MKLPMKILSLAAISTLVACGIKKDETANDFLVNDLDASAESGLTAISATLDDQAGSSLVKSEKLSTSRMIAIETLKAILPEAQASACVRALYEPCIANSEGGSRNTTFESCSLPSGLTMNGSVALNYTNSSCSLALGSSVTRTYVFSIDSLGGGSLAVSSLDHKDDNENTIGGGGRITRVDATSWNLEILGKHKVLTRNGRKLFDISLRTTAAMRIEGGLARSSRTLDGGSLEVIHNLAQFTATYQPHNLQWTGLCCHPVAGTVDVTYTGSQSGSGTITFTGCGSATLNKDGLNRELTLNYCE